MTQAIFKAVINNEGTMVAALAAFVDKSARFFIVQRHETQEQFIGRVSSWIKDQGGEGLQMQPPDVLPRGVPAAEFVLRMRVALGVDRSVPSDAAEFDVQNPQIMISAEDAKDAPN